VSALLRANGGAPLVLALDQRVPRRATPGHDKAAPVRRAWPNRAAVWWWDASEPQRRV
jgi:hypothetical protein